MDVLKQLQTFVQVVQAGSLSAAGREQNLVPAVIGRRLDALEERLGTRLLVRSTRRLTLTQEGSVFFEDAQRILAELEEAESAVASGASRVRGHLRISAPAGFGRRHVAPHVARFQQLHPELTVTLDLADRIVDLAAERVDCAIRISDLADSSLVAIKLANNRRVVVGAPAYLARHGIPKSPEDLARFQCLSLGASQARGWTFTVAGEQVNWKVNGTLACNDGAVLHEWALQGYGLAWRSLWEVKEDLTEGRLVTVLDAFSSPDYPVYAVMPQRKLMPQRVRHFVDFLKQAYAEPHYWG